MRTGILLTARLGSSRLKKKHLLSVNEQPILTYLIDRIETAFQKELSEEKVAIVIATSDETENREFEMFCSKNVAVFYGSLQNIPLRHLQAAEEYGFDNIVAIDGDDILCSVNGMKRVYRELIAGKPYVKTDGLPFGMNVMGYATAFLKASLEKTNCEILETGWGRIFDEDKITILNLNVINYNEYMRFTLDYPQDFEFFSKLITGFSGDLKRSTDQEIVDYVQSEKLYDITKVIASEYWVNFNTHVEKETNKKER